MDRALFPRGPSWLLITLALLCGAACGDESPGDADAECLASWGLRDDATDLCWQNPPAASYLDWEQAAAHCDELDVGGASDWRLPDIGELVSLLRGCDDGSMESSNTTSSCTMVPEGCVPDDACVDHASCAECEYYEGPAEDGCYWRNGLLGACTNVYWSASTDGGNGVNPWFVDFGAGGVGGQGPPSSVFLVRCVRGGES